MFLSSTNSFPWILRLNTRNSFSLHMILYCGKCHSSQVKTCETLILDLCQSKFVKNSTFILWKKKFWDFLPYTLGLFANVVKILISLASYYIWQLLFVLFLKSCHQYELLIETSNSTHFKVPIKYINSIINLIQLVD